VNVFFDVDYTILSVDGRLRTHVREVFEKLREDGHTIYIWSGVGLRTAEVRRFELDEYVTKIFVKPLADYRNEARRSGVEPLPDFCIDDHRAVVDAFGGYHISEYFFTNEHDQEMLRVYDAVRAYAAKDGRGLS